MKMCRSTFPFLLLLALACAPGDQRSVEIADLFALLPDAEVVAERADFSIGVAGEEPDLLGGWSFPERDRGRERKFRWGLRPASELELTVNWPRDLVVSFEGVAAPGARAPRSVELRLNDIALAELEVQPGLADYRFEIPQSVLARGRNRLALRYLGGGGDGQQASGHARPNLAMAWYRVVLGGLEASEPLEESEAGGVLLPYGTRVEYLLDVPEGSYLSIERSRFVGERQGSLEIHRESDSHEEVHLASLSPGGRLEADLEVVKREPIRLTLTAVASPEKPGGSGGGIFLVKPAVAAEAPELGMRIQEPASRMPNIVVYLVDTLRADRLGCYGHSRDVSPYLDRFAAGATLFENARAQSSWTLASVASIFTGVWPPGHGVVHPTAALSQEAETLAEILQEAGYATSAIAANGFVSEKFGLRQGFAEHLLLGPAGRDAQAILKETESWLESRDRSQPFFLYLHSLDPHQPYLPDEPYLSRFASGAQEMYRKIRAAPAKFKWEPSDSVREQLLMLYDALIAQNDAAFGATLEALDREGLLNDALVIFVSDHGEEFYEHRGWTHGANLFAETLDVPLVIKLPGQKEARRVSRLAQHIDLLPTLLDYLGIEAGRFPGRSLMPDLTGAGGEEHAPPVFGHTFRNKRENRSVIDSDWKFMERVVPGSDFQILVNWQEDPGDLRNLRAENPIRSEYLHKLIVRQVRESRLLAADEALLDVATRDDLRALGYLD